MKITAFVKFQAVSELDLRLFQHQGEIPGYARPWKLLEEIFLQIIAVL